MSPSRAGASSIDALRLSRQLIRLLTAVNATMGVLIAVMLVASLAAPDFVMKALAKEASNDPSLLAGMRAIMVIGILSTPLAHRILTRLLAIVDSVPLGPFIAANAARLRTMGKALLGLEILHMGVGAVGALIRSDLPAFDVSWSFSATRWLAVLMLFVLARVFEEGTRMREDLEGTV